MQTNKVVQWVEQGSVVIPKILMTSYKKLGLNEEEFVIILQLYQFLDDHNYFPTPNQFSEVMTLTSERCMELINSLVKKGFVKIDTAKDDAGIHFETYSLHPLWERMISMFFTDELIKQEEEQQVQAKNEFGELYQMFEAEFGRALSPFEVETIQSWLDDDLHSYDVIKVALKEAVLLGKLNFKYIDRILYEWKRNGVKDAHKAREKAENFRQNQYTNKPITKSQSPVKSENTTYQNFNWLEN